MKNRDPRLAAMLKNQADELRAFNTRFESMKKSLEERFARELAQIKQKHKVQQDALRLRNTTVEAAKATKH
jgi:hypothetical protein